MKQYHFAWLSVHPARSKEWLAERLADGFHIHHADGDHSNDDPRNLVLVEESDHLRIHYFRRAIDIFDEARRRETENEKKRRMADEELAKAYAAIRGGLSRRDAFDDCNKSLFSDSFSSFVTTLRHFSMRNNLSWPIPGPSSQPKPKRTLSSRVEELEEAVRVLRSVE